MSRAARVLMTLAFLVIIYTPARFLWAWAHRADHCPVTDVTDLERAYWGPATVGLAVGAALALLAVRIERRRS